MRNPVFVALGGLLALAAAMGIGRFVYTPILPFMVEEMSLSSGNAGLIASANFLGYLVGALAASMGFLPGSRRLWFLGALLLSALTTTAMGMTILIDGFLVLRFVGGIASAFVLVFSSALILERLNEAGRPGLSSIHFAGVGCGIAISSVAVAVLAANGMSWRALWVVSGFLTLLCLVIAAFLVPGESKEPATTTAQAAPPGRMSARQVRLIIGYGLFGFGLRDYRDVHFRHHPRQPGAKSGRTLCLADRRLGGRAIRLSLGAHGQPDRRCPRALRRLYHRGVRGGLERHRRHACNGARGLGAVRPHLHGHHGAGSY